MRLDEQERLDRSDHEPETPCETERSEHLRRHVFKDGHITWVRLPHDPIGYDADVLEEAYELGLKASDVQLANLRENTKNALIESQGKGAFQAAVTAYTRGPR